MTAHIRLPFGNPTNVAFGGPDLRTLYITTCKLIPRDGGPLPGSSLLGGVYSMRTVVAGIAEPLFGSG
jgi:sugar lactone lactonase YvrE